MSNSSWDVPVLDTHPVYRGDLVKSADGSLGSTGEALAAALPAQSGSGGPVTHDLGNFEIAGGLNGVLAWVPDPVIDLGAGTHVLKYTVTLIAVDWDGGDPANGLSIDIGFNDHATLNPDEVQAAGWGDRTTGQVGTVPPSLFTTDSSHVRYAAVGRMITGRYGWMSAFWNEDLLGASATVHVVVEVSL